MGTTQLLYIIAGLIFISVLSLLFLNSNRSQTDSNYYSEAVIAGIGIGQSLIDNIMTRAFDEQTVAAAVTATTSLTAAASLGPDAGEPTPTRYDDIDDFKNYVKLDTLGIMGIFRSSADVYYVEKMTPRTKTLTRTFTKRIDILVTNPYLKDTLKVNHIVTY